MNCREAQERDALLGSGLGQLGKVVADGNDPDKDGLPSKANATQLALGDLDVSGWLGGGECFADKSFSVMGRSFVIPFSKVCTPLLAFRYGLMLVASLLCFRMLRSSILGD